MALPPAVIGYNYNRLGHWSEEWKRRAEQRREAHGERKTSQVKIVESRAQEAR